MKVNEPKEPISDQKLKELRELIESKEKEIAEAKKLLEQYEKGSEEESIADILRKNQNENSKDWLAQVRLEETVIEQHIDQQQEEEIQAAYFSKTTPTYYLTTIAKELINEASLTEEQYLTLRGIESVARRKLEDVKSGDYTPSADSVIEELSSLSQIMKESITYKSVKERGY